MTAAQLSLLEDEMRRVVSVTVYPFFYVFLLERVERKKEDNHYLWSTECLEGIWNQNLVYNDPRNAHKICRTQYLSKGDQTLNA